MQIWLERNHPFWSNLPCSGIDIAAAIGRKMKRGRNSEAVISKNSTTLVLERSREGPPLKVHRRLFWKLFVNTQYTVFPFWISRKWRIKTSQISRNISCNSSGSSSGSREISKSLGPGQFPTAHTDLHLPLYLSSILQRKVNQHWWSFLARSDLNTNQNGLIHKDHTTK